MALFNSLIAPFTAIHTAYKLAFDGYLNDVVGSVATEVTGPLLSCVTLWVIVQGILVMRGDLDVRRGLVKLVSVSLVVGLVTSSALYQQYVVDVFEKTIPGFVQTLGGDLGLPKETVPGQLDLIFKAGESAFLSVEEDIPHDDTTDAMAFDGAQYMFFFTLWSIFGIYDTVGTMTSVLVTVGPIFMVGFLFEATAGITTRWIGQLIYYGILLLLTSIVATIVVATILAGMTAISVVTYAGGSEAGQMIGLYELDMFILTGNALVVALPTLAAYLSSGLAADGVQMGQSIYRRFARKPSPQSLTDMSLMNPK